MASSLQISAYQKAGVDIVKADRFVSIIAPWVKTTHNARIARVPNGYAGLYKLDAQTYLAATTDGVGTKLKLAEQLKRHDTVGIDLVAMSVNDLICVGAKPLFFLDYFATGKLDLKTSTAVLKGIVKGCCESGVALVGGETAEMPGFYKPGEYDLAGFSVGIVSKKNLLDGRRIRQGDLLIGLESSGIHSNGFSLVRTLIKPTEKNLLQKCLTPTRLYVKAALKLQEKLGPALKGLAHITGSGFLNIPRLSENFNYEIGYGKIQPLFEELKHRGGLTWEEMFTTFNMGVGLVAVIEPRAVIKTLRLLQKQGYPATVLGFIGSRTRMPLIRVRGEGFRVELKYQ